MGCNGWNHPPNCDCGWGGEFYESSSITEHWQRFSSYNVPNAHCPYCGEAVFFYRSPFNGSVYFDDLGPPWPKHPCMDTENLQIEKVRPANSLSSRIYSRLMKREMVWIPILCFNVQCHPEWPSVVVIKMLSQAGIFITLYAKFNLANLDYRTPFLIRTISKNLVFEISTLDVRAAAPSEVRFNASTTLKGLRAQLAILTSNEKVQSEPRSTPKQDKKRVNKLNTLTPQSMKKKQKLSQANLAVVVLPMLVKKKKHKNRTKINPADVPVTYRGTAGIPKKPGTS